MRGASYFLLAMLVTFMLGGWTPSAVSVGGELPCDRRGVSKTDLDTVRTAATAKAAPHQLDWKSVSGCRHRKGAWVNVNTVDEPRDDGSVITGASLCSRGKTRDWECEYYHGRQYRMNVMIAGKQRAMDATIPEKISVEAVTRMMQQAIDLAPGLTMDQVCD